MVNQQNQIKSVRAICNDIAYFNNGIPIAHRNNNNRNVNNNNNTNNINDIRREIPVNTNNTDVSNEKNSKKNKLVRSFSKLFNNTQIKNNEDKLVVYCFVPLF